MEYSKYKPAVFLSDGKCVPKSDVIEASLGLKYNASYSVETTDSADLNEPKWCNTCINYLEHIGCYAFCMGLAKVIREWLRENKMYIGIKPSEPLTRTCPGWKGKKVRLICT